jgi:transposase
MRYIGLDVHKDNITACVLSDSGKVVFEKNFEKIDGTCVCLAELFDHVGKSGFCVLMETGTYAYRPYRFFSDRGCDVDCVHAQCLKMITQTDKKTDKNDAKTIARMLRLWKRHDIDLQIAYMPTREQCELKDLCRYREEISKKIGDESRRIKSQMARNCQIIPEGMDDFQVKRNRRYVLEKFGTDQTLSRRMRALEQLFEERDIVRKQVESGLPNDPNVTLLEHIPGVGRQTAVQLMSMIVDISRFEDSDKFCAYFGLVPRVRDSGGKVHHGRMTKNGDRMMRVLMERVTQAHVRICDSSVTDYYNRLRQRMGAKKALITTSRKMLKTIFAVLKNQQEFRTRP